QGDPRGELIALQHAKKSAAAKALLKKHPEHFWGPAAEAQDMLQAYPYETLGASTAWRRGHFFSLWISNKFTRDREYGEEDEEGNKPELPVAKLLGALLDHPSSRFL